MSTKHSPLPPENTTLMFVEKFDGLREVLCPFLVLQKHANTPFREGQLLVVDEVLSCGNRINFKIEGQICDSSLFTIMDFRSTFLK